MRRQLCLKFSLKTEFYSGLCFLQLVTLVVPPWTHRNVTERYLHAQRQGYTAVQWILHCLAHLDHFCAQRGISVTAVCYIGLDESFLAPGSHIQTSEVSSVLLAVYVGWKTVTTKDADLHDININHRISIRVSSSPFGSFFVSISLYIISYSTCSFLILCCCCVIGILALFKYSSTFTSYHVNAAVSCWLCLSCSVYYLCKISHSLSYQEIMFNFDKNLAQIFFT